MLFSGVELSPALDDELLNLDIVSSNIRLLQW